MALEKYIEKRNFKKTPEPSAKKNDVSGGLKFVIQRHDASHLHYDFRLEMEGVLKSWAVPKGPSLNPHDKRLAMMVEDHPFSYRTFEGTIPEGNYGAGIVEIWDEGTYHSLETDDRKQSEKLLLKQLEEGSLKFELHGKKLKGEFALVKIKNQNSSKDNAWLLIKHHDKYAVEEEYSSEDHVPSDSKIVKKKLDQNRSHTYHGLVKETKKQPPPEPEHGKAPMQHQIVPMLAKVKEESFDSEEYIFEIKLDGYRAVAEVENGEVSLYSRNLLPFNHKYPTIVNSLKKFGHDVVLDGEIVALNEKGISSFQLMQQYEENPVDLTYYVFDILYIDGFDVTSLPLIERKKVLKQAMPELINIKFSDHIEKKGVDFFEIAQKSGLEGIMAKKADSPYRIGVRSSEWLKIKIIRRQEAIICGYTAPRGARANFGALILGLYENKKLIYIGHTGSGFTEQALDDMMKKLKPLIQSNSPFAEKIKTNEKVTWVKPQMVCEIAFTEWTGDGHMRHPVYQGLRVDKNAEDVVKEVEISREKNFEQNDTEMEKTKSKPSSAKAKVQDVNTEEKIGNQKLKLTHLDKVYWPEEGYTKGDLIDYYRKVSKWILPYLKDRPESLNRHPNGINGENFFQKDMGDSLPSWIKSKEIYSESNNKNITYMLCQDEATLAYMNNLGCIEINPWNSRIQTIDKPDFMIIDLDPGENTFEEVIETALVVKAVLDKAGADAYCKTSGATGMHIYIPLEAKYDYEQCKNFAHIIAELAHNQLPELTSLERSPKARRKQIYLDYLQNRTGQTLAAVYSVRPKPGATVSTPLEWKEVRSGLHPSQFTIRNIFERIEKKGDLFSGVLGKGIAMEKCLKNLGA